MEFGQPQWTKGHFIRLAAEDDLGFESVGASQLRRLLPGVIAATPNAGYYSYYTYLVARWAQFSDSIKRIDFKPFYRRQEAAYAVACALHEHRGSLIGINGSRAVSPIAYQEPKTVDVKKLADGYMDSAYGGYGLFYRGVLEDLRLTRMGAAGQIDKPTEIGIEMAEAFGETFEETEYAQKYFDADKVPLEVLRNLGESTCLCTVPDRSDHHLLTDAFLKISDDNSVWRTYERTRAESIGLFLEFHEQRPEDLIGEVSAWRKALASGQLGKHPWTTSFVERSNSWRAYQLREVETLCLLALWTVYLLLLGEDEPTTHSRLRQELKTQINWRKLGGRSTPLRDHLDRANDLIPDSTALISSIEELPRVSEDTLSKDATTAFVGLLRLHKELQAEDEGFVQLLQDGGPGRWSLAHLRDWIDSRVDQPAGEVLEELADELYARHTRVALGKISGTDFRDPFCFSEDEGTMRLLRTDAPFWTDGRFGVVNHLLWTLGLLETPSGDARLTNLGTSALKDLRANV